MVTVLPCSEALVSLVDKPPFVALVHDIEHVHFERVTFANKAFDMVIIFKAGSREKGQDEWLRVSSIPRIHLDAIKAWLCDIAEVSCSSQRGLLHRGSSQSSTMQTSAAFTSTIALSTAFHLASFALRPVAFSHSQVTYTEGAPGLDWKEVMTTIVRQDNFWLSEDDDGDAKPVGWEFLGAGGDAADGGSEDGEEEEGSEYSEDEESSEEEEGECGSRYSIRATCLAEDVDGRIALSVRRCALAWSCLHLQFFTHTLRVET